MVKLTASLFLCTAASFAITAGFSTANVPVLINQEYSVYEQDIDVPMITVGIAPLSGFRLEGYYGFISETEEEEHYYTDEVVDSQTQAFGLSSFYTLLSRNNVDFSAGARFLHSYTKVEEEYDFVYFKSNMNSYGPAARIDFSIPGLEDIGFYSQWGIDYRKTETTWYDRGEEIASEGRSEWKTAGPEYILSGIYYSF